MNKVEKLFCERCGVQWWDFEVRYTEWLDKVSRCDCGGELVYTSIYDTASEDVGEDYSAWQRESQDISLWCGCGFRLDEQGNCALCAE